MPVPMLTKAPMSAVVRPEKAIITGSMGRVKSLGIHGSFSQGDLPLLKYLHPRRNQANHTR